MRRISICSNRAHQMGSRANTHRGRVLKPMKRTPRSSIVIFLTFLQRRSRRRAAWLSALSHSLRPLCPRLVKFQLCLSGVLPIHRAQSESCEQRSSCCKTFTSCGSVRAFGAELEVNGEITPQMYARYILLRDPQLRLPWLTLRYLNA